MKKALIVSAMVLCAAALAWGGTVIFQKVYDRKCPNFSSSFELYVHPGMESAEVLDSILASGKVISPRSLRRTISGLTEVKVGHYTFDSKSSSMYAARMLSHGWQTPVLLTLSGAIRSPKTLARKIGAQMLVDSAEVASFIYCEDSLLRYGMDTTRLFCMVIPDSYDIKWTASVRDIFDRFKKEHDAWWTKERKIAAEMQDLTPEEVSILASIVDGETRYVPEQPTIAGVYLNRLRCGMKLQADPTVAYCFGYTQNRILRRHLEVDSPYNTYMYAGLPPGPISCPPKSCLEAVLHPEDHSYLYFCADSQLNGKHVFAVSYKDHLDNARAFQKALTKRLKEKQNS